MAPTGGRRPEWTSECCIEPGAVDAPRIYLVALLDVVVLRTAGGALNCSSVRSLVPCGADEMSLASLGAFALRARVERGLECAGGTEAKQETPREAGFLVPCGEGEIYLVARCARSSVACGSNSMIVDSVIPNTRTGPCLWQGPVRVCGEGEIRTHGTLAGTTVFETVLFNHSSTSPGVSCCVYGSNTGRFFVAQRVICPSYRSVLPPFGLESNSRYPCGRMGFETVLFNHSSTFSCAAVFAAGPQI